MAKPWIVKPLRIVAASSANVATVAGTPINVANDYAGLVWRTATAANSTGSILFDADLGADMAVDTIMIFGLAGLTGGLVRVRAAPAAAGVFVGAHYLGVNEAIFAGSEVPTSGLRVAILKIPAGAYKLIRLEFVGIPANEYLQFARLVIGTRIELDRGFAFGAGFGVRDLGSADFSAAGAFLRRRSVKLRTVGLTFPAVYKDEVEARVQPLVEQAGNGEPVALVTNSAEHSMRERRSYFGPLIGDLGTVWRVANGFEWRASLTDLFPIPKAV